MKKPKILFTKIIEEKYLGLLKDFEVDCIPFIKITKINPTQIISEINTESFNNYIVSSQNTVEAITGLNLKGKFYCVGKQTFDNVNELGFSAVNYEHSGIELAEYIIENNKEESFILLASDKRREELPNLLRANDVTLQEVICYRTELVLNKVKNEYDAVVFFSPSAVTSFAKNNTILPKTITFAIGNTTANQIIESKLPNQIIQPENPSMKEVIEVIKRHYDKE